MDLGAFSVSLAAMDLGVSSVFFETLGFAAMGGGDDGAVPGRPGDPPACAGDLRG